MKLLHISVKFLLASIVGTLSYASVTGVTVPQEPSLLESYLADEKWQQADEVTFVMMLEATGREEQQWIDVESMNNFPCQKLREIDRLWVEYSGGHFGFSVQKPIYLAAGNQVGIYEAEKYVNFGKRVGWREGSAWKWYNNFSFDLNSPQGNLPVLVTNLTGEYGSKIGYTLISSRLAECGI